MKRPRWSWFFRYQNSQNQYYGAYPLSALRWNSSKYIVARIKQFLNWSAWISRTYSKPSNKGRLSEVAINTICPFPTRRFDEVEALKFGILIRQYSSLSDLRLTSSIAKWITELGRRRRVISIGLFLLPATGTGRRYILR